MKKAFKFHLICNLKSKISSLIAKPEGRIYNNTQKGIVRLQKIGHQLKDDKTVYQQGRNLAYFIDEILSDGHYYTLYRFAGNLTLQEEKPISYYLTITEIFNILKLHYLFLSSEKVLNILEEKNLVSNYLTDYVNNKVIIPQYKNMNYSTISNSNNGHSASMNTRKLMENLMK